MPQLTPMLEQQVQVKQKIAIKQKVVFGIGMLVAFLSLSAIFYFQISQVKAITTTSDEAPEFKHEIAYWWGKVNQHKENGVWMTDPDGVSGANIDKYQYCKKWYPSTQYAIYDDREYITGWKNAGNVGNFSSEANTYHCTELNVTADYEIQKTLYKNNQVGTVYVGGEPLKVKAIVSDVEEDYRTCGDARVRFEIDGQYLTRYMCLNENDSITYDNERVKITLKNVIYSKNQKYAVADVIKENIIITTGEESDGEGIDNNGWIKVLQIRNNNPFEVGTATLEYGDFDKMLDYAQEGRKFKIKANLQQDPQNFEEEFPWLPTEFVVFDCYEYDVPDLDNLVASTSYGGWIQCKNKPLDTYKNFLEYIKFIIPIGSDYVGQIVVATNYSDASVVVPYAEIYVEKIKGLAEQIFQRKKTALAEKLLQRVKGKILLQVEGHGEAYYVSPQADTIYYLRNGNDAYNIMRNVGLGISEADYNALINNTNQGKKIRERVKGRILLRVQSHGEAYYVNPTNTTVTYMPNGEAAYNIMRNQSLGISNDDLAELVDF